MKKQKGYYLEEEYIKFIEDVADANDGLSQNFIANKVMKLGVEAYSKKINKNFKIQ